jgi:hypothetical protein
MDWTVIYCRAVPTAVFRGEIERTAFGTCDILSTVTYANTSRETESDTAGATGAIDSLSAGPSDESAGDR